MRKYICFIFIVLCFCSCQPRYIRAYYPTSKNFNNFKHLESLLYLCYIDSKPEIKSLPEIDTVVISHLRYRFGKKDISNFEMLVFDIKAVESFMGEKAFYITRLINNDRGEDMPNREFYLTRYNKVYLFIDKSNKADIASKEVLFKSYKNKNLIIVERGYFIEPQGTSKPMISTQIYELDKHTRFDHLIRIE